MRSVRQTCFPREEVERGDLDDAIFAADFGHVIEERAPRVYQDPVLFFRNTHPASELRKIMDAVFTRLSDPGEAGACVRLSTGFGGGKTHTLIAMWHLARNIGNPSLGGELVEAERRPRSVRVAGVDGEKLGYPIARHHTDASPRSLWGELAYQLGGKQLLAEFQQCDDAEASPSADLLRLLFQGDEPVPLLLDELVKYMVKLPERASKNLISFIGLLSAEVARRPQTVLVITDPAAQAAYAEESDELQRELAVAKRLDDELGRRSTDYDPIGSDAARVITRRLFEHIDPDAAEEAAREYSAAYKRIAESRPDVLPKEVTTEEYANRIRECYPFHPRLVMTAQDRLGTLPAFNKSRGTLRLFARVLRQLWEDQIDVPLITAGDVRVEAERIQADLLQRLDRDEFSGAVQADCVRHAQELDAEYGGDYHRRVARALLIESLPMNPNAAMDVRDVTLATVRPSDVGNEPHEALDRLLSVGWYTFPSDSGNRYQFRVEPNVNKRIEEVADTIPPADARQDALTYVQRHYGGPPFKLYAFPTTPRAVPDSADLKLVLCDSLPLAREVCEYLDDSDPNLPEKRPFRNAIVALAPSENMLHEAVHQFRRLKAARSILDEARRSNPPDKLTEEQINKLLPSLQKQARIRVLRSFHRLVLQGRDPLPLEEGYLVSEDGALSEAKGPQNLLRFLESKGLIFTVGDRVDVDLLFELLKGATPSVDHKGAYTAK